MASAPRLNSVISALEQGKTPIATFVSPPTVEGAIASRRPMTASSLNPNTHAYDIKDLRDCLQVISTGGRFWIAARSRPASRRSSAFRPTAAR